MRSLIGVYIVCNVVFNSYNPDIKREVQVKADGVTCRVEDDRQMRVGSPGYVRTPILVDCSKAINWLKPTNTDGTFLFFKEDGDCVYE